VGTRIPKRPQDREYRTLCAVENLFEGRIP
jgi:hypothetical protein